MGAGSVPAGTAIAGAALSLVGTPFRLQGRDPATGLDCLGLVIASFAAGGVRIELPADYRPHRRSPTLPHEAICLAGLLRVHGPRHAGDALLLVPGAAQMHAAIAVSRSDIVHAHAGLRRVVRSPLPDHWRIVQAWRTAPEGGQSWQH